MAGIEMFWWRQKPNFGDALNPLLIERLFGVRPKWTKVSQATLIGAGSVLQIVAREDPKTLGKGREVNVWGSGYIYDEEQPIESSRVHYHAVRGRRTQEFGRVGDVPLGDPGILSSFLVEKTIATKYLAGIVPHYHHFEDSEVLRSQEQPNVKIIDVRKEPLEVVKDIASCALIFSSSLHGLVVADSLGVPNQWVGFQRELRGDKWKFYDYYSAFGNQAPVRLPFRASLLSEDSIGDLASSYEAPTGLSERQQALVKAFPRHLISG